MASLAALDMNPTRSTRASRLAAALVSRSTWSQRASMPGIRPGSTRIARGDLATEVAALKAEPGGEIMAHGGAAFVQALSRHRLIDEYRLVILPVALGAGLPLFKDLPRPLRLDLAESRSFSDGTIINIYQPLAT
ncbi:MAG TPA: dihydrofolate reductase family protein, partial [Streptosporangiaceae bacterium]|nr:dihydrofolate reductase family protein [Streptosporangiaceae bacterium]